MTKQLGFYYDQTVCIGCKTCQVACKAEHDLPVGVIWRRVFDYGNGSWAPEKADQPGVVSPFNVFAYSTSIACNHCANPQCLAVCPTGAISKREDGIVLIDENKCVGCRYCEWACPYGAPQFNEEQGVMTKCNFCYNLLDQGREPLCVSACMMRALHFGDLEELRKQYGTVDAVEPLPAAEMTHPSLVINPHRHAQISGQGTGHIMNMPEEV